MKKEKQSKKSETASNELPLPTNLYELDVEYQYNVEQAFKELGRAMGLMDEGRSRAKAQHHLREALMWITKTPPGFKDEAFNAQYDKTYNKLYRGY